MNTSPSQSESNGRNTQNGRFAPGNTFSKGNSLARNVAKFRARLFKAVAEIEFEKIINKLVVEAKRGKPWAVRLALEYLTGGPRAYDLLERLDQIETELQQKGLLQL